MQDMSPRGPELEYQTMDTEDAMDVEMEDTSSNGGDHAPTSNNSVHSHHSQQSNQSHYSTEYGGPGGVARMKRRGSMSEDEERERRASIKAILADTTISPRARRRSIQHLMDGRRGSMGGSSTASSGYCTPDLSDNENEEAGGVNLDNNSCHSRESVSRVPTVPVLDQNIAMNGSQTCIFINNEQARRAEMTRPPCTHYDRKCTMIAPCCGAAFGCRICHDDCPILPPKIEPAIGRRYHRSSSLPSSFTSMESQNQDTHHTIDRFAVREVICRECFTRQSSKTNNCVNCGIQFGAYHCNVCNLWMSNDEKPYHCKDCGFCRVGGAENFQHCHDCGMCIDRSLYSNHNCKSGKYKSNCPVCQEFLFSSRSASHEMPCGHAIHWECFRQLAAHDSRCPVCKKTAETRERMMPTWNAMAAGVALQPVPPELARVVNITCNDCERSDDARAWHFLGVQCRICSSFNTVVDRIIMSGEEAHEFLETMQARRTCNTVEEEEEQPRPEFRRRINRRRSHF